MPFTKKEPATVETPKPAEKQTSVVAGFSKELATFTEKVKDAAAKIGGDVAKRYADSAVEKLEQAVSDLANAEAQDG